MSYQQFTLADIRTRLRQRYEGKPFWDATEAKDAVNEALRCYNLLTGRWRGRTTVSTSTTPANLYTIATTLFYRARLTFNGLPVAPTSREALNGLRRQWRTETTLTGDDVPTRPAFWAPVSLRSFYLWPADAAGGNTLTIDGVAVTPVLVDDGDFIDIGEELLTILLDYALHVLTFKKGGQLFAATLPKYRAFLAAAAEENGQLKSSMAFRRIMGLDHRDFKPLRGVPSRIDPLVNPR